MVQSCLEIFSRRVLCTQLTTNTTKLIFQHVNTKSKTENWQEKQLLHLPDWIIWKQTVRLNIKRLKLQKAINMQCWGKLLEAKKHHNWTNKKRSMFGNWKEHRRKLTESFVSFRPEVDKTKSLLWELFWNDFKNNIGMRPQLCSSDKCQILRKLKDWITRESKNVKTKRDKRFDLWVQAPSEMNKNPYKNKGSKIHRLIKTPSETVIVRNFERIPTGLLYFAHWNFNWQKMNPKASHTLKISMNTSRELGRKRQKPKLIALTGTWLTKPNSEAKQQWKTGRTNLEESYGIAKCSPLISIPWDSDRKNGDQGYSLHESLNHKGVENP